MCESKRDQAKIHEAKPEKNLERSKPYPERPSNNFHEESKVVRIMVTVAMLMMMIMTMVMTMTMMRMIKMMKLMTMQKDMQMKIS